MAVQRAHVEYTDQPYFNKAAERPQNMPASNTNAAPEQTRRVIEGPWGRNKAQTTYKTSNGPVRSAQSTDEIFSDQYSKAGLQPANQNRTPDQTSKARASYTQPSNVPRVSRTTKSHIPTVQRKKKVSVEKKLLARVRVTSANAWIGSWAMFWYLTFQMPLAVMSAAGLGMTYAVYTYIASIPAGDTLLRIGRKAIELVGDLAASAGQIVNFVTGGLFGFEFNPILLFITPFALVFLLGLFQLILTWFVYRIMRIKSLSGTAGGLKGLMFVLAGVGYAIPILNLFPLIFLWMIVVWMYPK